MYTTYKIYNLQNSLTNTSLFPQSVITWTIGGIEDAFKWYTEIFNSYLNAYLGKHNYQVETDFTDIISYDKVDD